MIPGLSTSSSSSLPTSPPMTLLRQEIDHPKSSSSSSTSTPMTSSTEIDRSDHPPAIVSSESVERKVRGDPYSSETSEELLNKSTKIPKSTKNENHGKTHIIPIFQNGCKNSERILWMKEFLNAETHTRVSSHEVSLEPTRSADLGKHSVFFSIPEKPILRDLPEDQNHKGTVQKMYWQSRTSCRKFW